MPTYVYKFVETGETIEVQQAFTDDTLTEVAHPDSGQVMAVKKVFQPVGVTFRGSGFFKTDNRGASTTADTAGTGSGGDSRAKDSTGGSKGDSATGSSGDSAKPAATDSPKPSPPSSGD